MFFHEFAVSFRMAQQHSGVACRWPLPSPPPQSPLPLHCPNTSDAILWRAQRVSPEPRAITSAWDESAEPSKQGRNGVAVRYAMTLPLGKDWLPKAVGVSSSCPRKLRALTKEQQGDDAGVPT